MRFGLRFGVAGLSAVLALALMGCSGPRYEIWRSHDSHYATWSHAKFSVKKVFESSKPTPEEMEESLKENWWGELFSGGN